MTEKKRGEKGGRQGERQEKTGREMERWGENREAERKGRRKPAFYVYFCIRDSPDMKCVQKMADIAVEDVETLAGIMLTPRICDIGKTANYPALLALLLSIIEDDKRLTSCTTRLRSLLLWLRAVSTFR